MNSIFDSKPNTRILEENVEFVDIHLKDILTFEGHLHLKDILRRCIMCDAIPNGNN